MPPLVHLAPYHVHERIADGKISMISKVTFRRVSPKHPMLASVICSSIGDPNPEKIAQVLQGYDLPDQILLGAFSSEKLIAVIGTVVKRGQASIKHLSVLQEFREQGIDGAMIYQLINIFILGKILVETDDETVDFYRHMGFICSPFKGKFGTRYHCYLNP